MSRRFPRGLVIGKFDPFHRGHGHLVAAAESRCERVTAIVCATTGDSVPAPVRAEWLSALHPALEVLVADQDALGLDDDDSEGWARATVDLLGSTPDVVFTSEAYGDAYAGFLGCLHVLVDRERRTVPVSGSAIRADPLGHLEFLEPAVRAYYVRRVCLIGAESSGKTTLASALAEAFGTVWAPELGHLYQALGRDDPHGPWESREFVYIARLHAWLEDFQAALANRVLFCDTDLHTTALWHEAFLDAPVPAEVTQLAQTRSYDLYLLCDLDIPFRQDGYNLREVGRRGWMQARYRRQLESSPTPWVSVSGPLAHRVATASRAITEQLGVELLSG